MIVLFKYNTLQTVSLTADRCDDLPVSVSCVLQVIEYVWLDCTYGSHCATTAYKTQPVATLHISTAGAADDRLLRFAG